MHQFLDWLTPFTFGFAVIEGGALFVFGDRPSAMVSIVLAAFGVVLLAARRRLHRGQVGCAVGHICAGMLIATALVVPIQPDWSATMAMIPLLAVTVALPYVRGRSLVATFVVALAVVCGTAVIGELSATTTTLPVWFDRSFRVASLTAAAATLLLLLWQFSTRLSSMLAQTRAAEERYALAARGANDGLWDWDLGTDRIYFSPRWQAMVGEIERECVAPPWHWLQRVHPDDRNRVDGEITAHLTGQTSHLEMEYRLLHADGGYRWMLTRGIVVHDAQKAAIRIAGSQTDITARKEVEQQLVRDALHDALTGLPNRTLFLDRLGQAIERRNRRLDYQFVVLFLDMDRFKTINDGLGHIVGDQLLVAMANRISRLLRSIDTVARLGGDEFTILLDDLSESDQADAVVERLREQLQQPDALDAHEVYTTVSLGIVFGSAEHGRPEELLRDADTALYRAKAQGGATSVVFDREMHTQAVAQLHLENDLRRAFERHEFRAVYQPVISLHTGRLTGFEALVRWDHPQRGVVSPAEFIPIAEETGLIVPLGEWMLETACHQLAQWLARHPTAEPLTMSVNVSGKQIVHTAFLGHLETALRKSALPPHHLRLEITESVVMQYGHVNPRVYDVVRALGLQLQMDDFGTGYSSMGRLHELPIDALKIDRSFVSRLGDGDDRTEIVQTIVSLAHHLGMSVIAEGVETDAQLSFLRSLGCDFGQGFLFARPLDAACAEAVIAANGHW